MHKLDSGFPGLEMGIFSIMLQYLFLLQPNSVIPTACLRSQGVHKEDPTNERF